MKTCTEAEKAFLDLAFSGDSGGREHDEAIWAARGAVLKERLSPELLEQAVRVRVDLLKARKRDGEIWDKLAALGFVGDEPGGRLFKQIQEEAKKRIDFEPDRWAAHDGGPK